MCGIIESSIEAVSSRNRDTYCTLRRSSSQPVVRVRFALNSSLPKLRLYVNVNVALSFMNLIFSEEEKAIKR